MNSSAGARIMRRTVSQWIVSSQTHEGEPMQKINFSTTINAPRDVVWDTMLKDATYREWTSAFNPHGSWYEGSWEEGSTIRFLGPDENGQVGGMVSRIK